MAHLSPPAGSAPAFIRLDFLDALRGFAACYVLVYHLALIPSPHLEFPGWMALYAASGGTGVTLFFVLSAFALAYSLDARHDEPHRVRRFYLRRFFRIAPLFYCMLLLYYGRDLMMFDVAHSFEEVLINVSLLFNLSPTYMAGYVWASWTIGVEVLVYLVFPLVHHRIRTLPAALGLLAVAAAIAALWDALVPTLGVSSGLLRPEQVESVKSIGLLRHLPAFVLGLVSYRIFRDHLPRLGTATKRALGALLLLLFVALYTGLLTGKLPAGRELLSTWLALSYALLVLGLAAWPTRLLVNRASVATGKISYSIYLLHPTLILLLAPVYHWLYQKIDDVSLAYGSALLITAVPLFALSWLSYRHIERPGIAWGERLIGGRPRPVAVG
ncbi:acyltransferase [Marichromatium sp. AB31]|uniref:acyltransferase family protein n=1 Tax=Marichromatium sp. AB31 TaxID=2483362 RepID=UPI000F3DFD15|nr:acyltransferase [Marichromatium sp. AB31]RNE88923.1 acyltransferase [Marichromatium sp. AB31]